MTTSAFVALRSPAFALLWSAQIISGFGDRITLIALAYVTWSLTGSALSTALSIVIGTLPHALFGFFGGAIADSIGHRRSMIAADVVRLVAIGAIPLTLASGSALWLAYILVLVAALCATIFNPARLALVPDLVSSDRLGASNSLIFSSDRIVEIIGVLVAGAIVALLGVGAFYVDAASFGASALLLCLIAHADAPPRRISWSSLLGDAADGARILRDSAVLRANTVFSLLGQLALPVMNGLMPVLVFREYGLGASDFAATEAAIAIGAVGSGVVYPSVFSRYRKGRLIVAGFALFGAILLGIALSPGIAPTLGLLVGAGFANVLFYVSNVTLAQEVTPPALRARVFGARSALLRLTWLPMILASGALAERLPVQPLFAGAAAFTLVVAVVGASRRSVRDVG